MSRSRPEHKKEKAFWTHMDSPSHGVSPDEATASPVAPESVARSTDATERIANDYARTFNKMAAAKGVDLPLDLCFCLVQLFAAAIHAEHVTTLQRFAKS